jgi:hypothetical protein
LNVSLDFSQISQLKKKLIIIILKIDMTEKYTATWYCSKNAGSVGCVDNPLKIGDVAIDGLHPIKKGTGKANFTYVRFLNKVYRVADRCDIPNNVDIYQGIKNKC